MATMTQVMILFCGQGMTTLVEVYADGVIKADADFLALVDCGGSSEWGKLAVKYVADKILAKKDKTLDLLVVSHQDSDHVALLKQLEASLDGKGAKCTDVHLGGSNWIRANKNTVKSFVTEMDVSTDDIEFDAPYMSDYEDVDKRADLGYLAKYKDVYIRTLVSGLDVTATGRHTADIVKNASSAVVVVENGTSSIVLPGDATYQTMDSINDILDEKNLVPKVVGFEIPHHGALRTAVEDYFARGEPTDFDWTIIRAFATHLAPERTVASAGPRNTHRHPVEEVLNVFEAKLVAAPSHGYCSYVFSRGKGATSEGWTNYSKITMAEHCTVHKLAGNDFTYGDLSIKLTAPGLLAPDEIVTFHPRGHFGPGGVDEGPIVYAPAP